MRTALKDDLECVLFSLFTVGLITDLVLKCQYGIDVNSEEGNLHMKRTIVLNA